MPRAKKTEPPKKKRRAAKETEKKYIPDKDEDSDSEDNYEADTSSEVPTPEESSSSSEYADEEDKTVAYGQSLVNISGFDQDRWRVGVDVGSQNFAAAVTCGKLGKVKDVLYTSLHEYGEKRMEMYDYAAAAGAMVRENPHIFKPGRILFIENQFPKSPIMPVIAGAIIGACVAIGMQYTAVFPDTMYKAYYGRSGGSNAANKKITQVYIPRVLKPREKILVSKAVKRKKGADEDRGYDPAKSDDHHCLDAIAMTWYGKDNQTGGNTYRDREDELSSSESSSDSESESE